MSTETLDDTNANENAAVNDTAGLPPENEHPLLSQLKEAFQKLHELIESPADVALNFIKQALETPEGKTYIAEALANNLEFRQRMQQEPEMPPRDFSNLEAILSATQVDANYSPVRIYSEDDPIYSGALVTYMQGPQNPNSESRFFPEIEELIRRTIKETNFEYTIGTVFYVWVRPIQDAVNSTPGLPEG